MWLNRPHEVTALLIDGANTYETAKRVGYNLDYAKIIRYFKPRQAMYFTALPEKDINKPNGLFKMIDYINFNGYTIHSKPTKEFVNSTRCPHCEQYHNEVTLKGNMDIEMAVHTLKAARWANNLIIFTGDGDFRMAIEDVQHQGVVVTVVSAHAMPMVRGERQPPMIADELRRQANHFMDLCDPKVREQFEWLRER